MLAVPYVIFFLPPHQRMYSKFVDYIRPRIEIDMSKYLPKDTLIVLDEISRIVTIQIVIQFMFAMSNNECMSLELFLANVLYTIVGICVYWLVLKKLVSFK